MAASGKTIRRVLGVLFLGLAGGMLILGATVLEPRLEGRTFVWYWLICFLFLWLALIAAWLDILAVRRQARAAQRDLIREIISNEMDSDNKE